MSDNGRASCVAASDGRALADRNGFGHGHVAEVQRGRLLGAIVAEAAERGAANVSVAHVVARAGVSRRTFYELFADREDCFLAAFEDALSGLARAVVPAYDRAGSWQERMRAALQALLEFLDYDRARARLLIVESLACGPKVLAWRQSMLARVVGVVDRGRLHGRRGAEPPPMSAEGALGGVLSILYGRLVENDGSSLTDLGGSLMGMIVLPYLGPAAASREARRPAPERRAPLPSPSRSDPLKGLDMRLTYRTMRVLSVIAQDPGSSNRAIGEAAEIGDQGQVSKLLARLRRLGLVENTGAGAAARGEPNAWRLTARGAEVNESLVRLEG